MITITSPTTREDFKAYYALRYKVLSEPAGHPKGTEKDDSEPISEHFMAVNEAGDVLGAIKMYEKAPGVGHVSHLAVAPEFQHQGVGQMLMETLEKQARVKGYKNLEVLSRVTVTAEYEKLGFHVSEIPPLHLGIVHQVLMEKKMSG